MNKRRHTTFNDSAVPVINASQVESKINESIKQAKSLVMFGELLCALPASDKGLRFSGLFRKAGAFYEGRFVYGDENYAPDLAMQTRAQSQSILIVVRPDDSSAFPRDQVTFTVRRAFGHYAKEPIFSKTEHKRDPRALLLTFANWAVRMAPQRHKEIVAIFEKVQAAYPANAQKPAIVNQPAAKPNI